MKWRKLVLQILEPLLAGRRVRLDLLAETIQDVGLLGLEALVVGRLVALVSDN